LEIKMKFNKLCIVGKNTEGVLISTVVNNQGILETFYPTIRFNGRLWIP